MTGADLLGLILLSMAWLYFLIGLIRPEMGFVPGLVGSVAVFFTIPALARYGVEVPWPWLWILLPLVLVLRAFRRRR
jgi:uncharacterized membrane protein YdbT with pleckstrin-like domain